MTLPLPAVKVIPALPTSRTVLCRTFVSGELLTAIPVPDCFSQVVPPGLVG